MSKTLDRVRIEGRRAWILGMEPMPVLDMVRVMDATQALWGEDVEMMDGKEFGHLCMFFASKADMDAWLAQEGP